MTVAGMGMATSGALSYAVCRGPLRLVDASTPVSLAYWLRNILPVGLFMAGTLWAGNLVRFECIGWQSCTCDAVWTSARAPLKQAVRCPSPCITLKCLPSGLPVPERVVHPDAQGVHARGDHG